MFDRPCMLYSNCISHFFLRYYQFQDVHDCYNLRSAIALI